MNGTPEQIEWAERIKLQLNADLIGSRAPSRRPRQAAGGGPERIPARHCDPRRKAPGVWQAIRRLLYSRLAGIAGSVRQLIARDPRYQAIKANRKTRNHSPNGSSATEAGSN